MHRVLLGKPEGKRLLGILGRTREDCIEMDIQELGCSDMDCIELARDS